MILLIHIIIVILAINSFNPLMLAGCLLLSAISRGLLLGLLNTPWFFYFLILIFLGGVIVVVLFICSVCTNKKFFFQNNSISLFMVVAASPLILYRVKPSLFKLNFSSHSLIISLFLKENFLLLITLLTSLLACMICVIFISKLDRGPLLKNF